MSCKECIHYEWTLPVPYTNKQGFCKLQDDHIYNISCECPLFEKKSWFKKVVYARPTNSKLVGGCVNRPLTVERATEKLVNKLYNITRCSFCEYNHTKDCRAFSACKEGIKRKVEKWDTDIIYTLLKSEE